MSPFDRRILQGDGEGTPVGLASATACSCREGRIFANVQPAGQLPLWESIPCPRCRPDASPVTADGKVKSADGRLAAARARSLGA